MAGAKSVKDPYDAFRDRILAVVGLEAPPTEEERMAVDPGIIQSIMLYYTDPAANSDKVYKVWIIHASNAEYITLSAYGRRGGNLKQSQKYRGSLASAKRVYQDLVNEKTSKGYTESTDGGFR